MLAYTIAWEGYDTYVSFRQLLHEGDLMIEPTFTLVKELTKMVDIVHQYGKAHGAITIGSILVNVKVVSNLDHEALYTI